LWELLQNKITTDAWLLCTEELLPVHRTVLAACSPYFREIIAKVSGINGQPVVILPRAHPDLMQLLLEYMYLGEVDVPEEHLDGLESLARYFKMQDLCEALDGAQRIVEVTNVPRRNSKEDKGNAPNATGGAKAASSVTPGKRRNVGRPGGPASKRKGASNRAESVGEPESPKKSALLVAGVSLIFVLSGT
jgi:hypothetical protein